MSRIAAPAAKLTRSLNTATSRTSSLLDTQRNAGAALMPKYDELLRSRRSSEHSDSSRHLYTTHRPTPQPSIANRPKPLMQTFHSSTAPRIPSTHLDATILPAIHETALPEAIPRAPLLPDNYGAYHILESSEVSSPEITIVASDPDNVVAGAPMAEIEGVSLDGVELKFAHETPLVDERDEGGFLGDMWRGMVDDVFGPAGKKTAN
ncbi:Fc.00g099990.m01.CDS01 [Cosmosporella sp. VM-42]